MIGSDGHIHAHAAFGDVPLPAHPKEGEALVHEGGVAEIGGGAGVGGVAAFLEDAEEGLAAAVADFIEEAVVGAGGVDGFEEEEIGGEGDFIGCHARGVAGGEGQVDDGGVGGQGGVEREMDFAGDFLVGAGEGEGLAVEDWGSGGDAEVGDSCLQGGLEGGRTEKRMSARGVARMFYGNCGVGRDWLSAAGQVLVPSVVLGELRSGFRRGSREAVNLRQLEQFLAKPLVRVVDVSSDTAA